MTRTLRAFIKASLFLLLLCGPFISGGLPLLVFVPLLLATSVIALYGFSSRAQWATNTTIVVLTVALATTACDFGLRFTNLVPDDLVERWPRMPLVNRYMPNISVEDHRFSGLARMAGNKDWIETKRIRLVTDANGFRNENVDPAQPLDVIILGDSFGAGAVTQEDTWTSIFVREHGLKAYNLSAPAVGPWHEYVNLVAERDRLNIKRGTSIVWQIFPGNDLDDYYGSLELKELPWNGRIKQWWTRI